MLCGDKSLIRDMFTEEDEKMRSDRSGSWMCHHSIPHSLCVRVVSLCVLDVAIPLGTHIQLSTRTYNTEALPVFYFLFTSQQNRM